MPHINLIFPVVGPPWPALRTDHAYALYSAVCRLAPCVHVPDYPLGISPIGGDYVGQGTLQLVRHSRLKLRLPAERIPDLLPLAGQPLDLDGATVRLGVPRIVPVLSSTLVAARLVTIKNHQEPEAFRDAVVQQLVERDVDGRVELPLTQRGPRQGQPRRRVLRIHGRHIVGYAVQVSGLSDGDSIRLQETGLGGRRKLGCGIFEPVQELAP